jgi:hypothetical protein
VVQGLDNSIQATHGGGSSLCPAICAYLSAEPKNGAAAAELPRLRLGGRSRAEEGDCVSDEVSRLVEETLLGLGEGRRVAPA